jgi:Gpi18-like mannosyltransferase
VNSTRLKELLTPRWQLALFGALHIVMFSVIFQTVYNIQYTPAGIYINFASQVLDGKLPYRDFAFEYPPLSLIFFIIPKVFSSDWTGFSRLFHVEALIFDLLALLLLYLIARRLGKMPWNMLGVYTLAVLAMGPIIENQYDIFPAVVTLAAIYCFWTDRHKTAWFLVALGTLIKLYPIVLAPIFLIIYYRNRQFSRAWVGILTLVATCWIVLIPFLVTGPAHLLSLIDYHTQRGIQMESLYGAILLLLRQFGWISARVEFTFGSWNLTGNAAQALDRITIYLLILAILASLIYIYRKVRPGISQFTRLGSYFLLIILAILLTSKILSPQYLIWLIPALPLVFGARRLWLWLIFLVIGGLTYYIFPAHYLELIAYSPRMVIILAVRDALLVALTALAIFNLARLKASD